MLKAFHDARHQHEDIQGALDQVQDQKRARICLRRQKISVLFTWSWLVKIDFMAALVGRRLEHVSEEILLMINEPVDLSNLQLVSMSVQCILRCPLIPVTVQARAGTSLVC